MFAADNWAELDGLLLLEGINLWDLPVSRAVSVLWTVALRNLDDKERSKRIAELTRPTARRMRAARDDFWAGYEEDAAAFLRAQGGGGEFAGDAFG